MKEETVNACKAKCVSEIYQAVEKLNLAIARKYTVPGLLVELKMERDIGRGGVRSIKAEVTQLILPDEYDSVSVTISEPA